MAKDKKEKLLLKEPTYPGGQKAMLLFIQNNLQYPPEAIAAKVEGTVRIRFSIDHTGKVFKSQVISSLGHGCDEEAHRLVKLLRFIVPKVHKLRVEYHRTLNIHFKVQEELPITHPVEPSTQYTIHYVEESANGKNNAQHAPSYHYTISIG